MFHNIDLVFAGCCHLYIQVHVRVHVQGFVATVITLIGSLEIESLLVQGVLVALLELL